MSPNWTNDDGSCAPCRDEARGGAPCFIHHAKPAPKRRRTTAPSVSARLRTAEAEVERLRGLCAEARDMLRNMPWRRGGDALVTRLDRAALGEP